MVSKLRPTFFLPHPNLARRKLNTGDTKTNGLPHPPAPTPRAIFWHRQDNTISHPSPATISEAKFGERDSLLQPKSHSWDELSSWCDTSVNTGALITLAIACKVMRLLSTLSSPCPLRVTSSYREVPVRHVSLSVSPASEDRLRDFWWEEKHIIWEANSLEEPYSLYPLT